MLLCQLFDELNIQRFDETHVGDAGIDLFRSGECRCQHAAKGENGDIFAAAAHFALAHRQSHHIRLYGNARPLASWITYGCRAVVHKSGVEHLPALVFVGWRHDGEVGNAAHEAQIKIAGMRRAIGTHQPGTVDGKQHRQVLQRNIVDELIVGTL